MMHKPKKSLGQNFLKSTLALNKIITAGEIKPSDMILEIGPGKGALTEKLLQHAKLVIAVEKDRELFEFLKKKFAEQVSSSSLVLVHDDILKFNIEQNILEQNYKIIANIPYNITGAILKKFLNEKHQPKSMILMVQHEVAKRIVAQNKKESLLSISVKAYGEPKLVMKVSARYFSPAPKVDSAIIEIKNISRKQFVNLRGRQVIDEEKFWKIVKAGFAHKRKKLSGNLRNVLNSSKKLPLDFANKRAEDLTLLDWINIAKM